MKLKITYLDKDILVAVKPAGIPSQPDKTGDLDFLSLLQEEMKKRGETNSYIGLLHRLDRPVGGLMVFARNKECEGILGKLIQEKKMKKSYEAVVLGKMTEQKGELRDYLWKDGKKNTSMVVQKGRKDSKEAVLTYETLGETTVEGVGVLTKVSIYLQTGRHHQIRVQFSSRGNAIYGDAKYGGMGKNPWEKRELALWSKSLCFPHPRTKETMAFEEVPSRYPFSLF